MSRIYLDNNASTPIDPRLLKVLMDVHEHCIGNPSSIHSYGQASRKRLHRARKQIASFLGVSLSEIIFNSGGTEGANLLIQGLTRGLSSGHIVTSSIEHACVLEPIFALEKEGVDVSYLSPGEKGAVTSFQVKEAIRSDTQLIALMAANNETGVKIDLKSIAQVAEEAKIPLIVDGVALLGKDLFTIPSGVSAMFFSGHKIHAPKGVGFSFVRKGVKLKTLFYGGGHEFGKRSGTENLSGIVAMGESLSFYSEELAGAVDRMSVLRDTFERALFSSLDDVVVNGGGDRVSNTSNLAFMGVDGESLLLNLDMEGVAASHGSACSSGALEPSKVLLNMGLSRQRANCSIRFSLSRMTTEEEVNRAVEVIFRVVVRLRGMKKR